MVGHPEAAAAHGLPTLDSQWSASAQTVDGEAADRGLSGPERRLWRAFDDALGVLAPRQRVGGYDVGFAWTAPWGMTVAIEIDDDDPEARRGPGPATSNVTGVFNLVGWQVVRIPGWYCYAHPEAVIGSLRDTLRVLQEPTSATVELMPWVGRYTYFSESSRR